MELLLIFTIFWVILGKTSAQDDAPPIASPLPNIRSLVDANQVRSLYASLGNSVSQFHGNPQSVPIRSRPPDTRAIPNAPIPPIEQANTGIQDIAFQMDQILTTSQINGLIQGTQARRKRQALRITTLPEARWPDAILYYNFAPAINPTARAAVLDAMSLYTQNTCIRFQESNTQSPRVTIGSTDPAGGCWSYVGRMTTLPQQPLNLGPGCQFMSIAAHELAHALGVFHEQSRHERILFHGAMNDMNLYNLPYDVGSNMQYGPYAFAIDPSRPVMDTIIPNLFFNMGQYFAPTFRDLHLMNVHYQCSAKCPQPWVTCLNGGYVDTNQCSRCKCPPGWAGNACSAVEVPTITGCGGTLTARNTDSVFSISMPLDNNANNQRRCIYHIRPSTVGNQLVINVTNIATFCENGCYTTAVEVKFSVNQEITGARFCCSNQPAGLIISNAASVPIILFSRRSPAIVTFRYRQRPAPTG